MLELQQNNNTLRMVGLAAALLRSGCASAADRPFLNFTFHGNQNDDDDQIIKIPKHDDIWLIGGRGRN